MIKQLAVETGVIKLIRRRVYGRTLTYPDCPVSEAMARFGQTKTFTPAQVEYIRDVFIPLGVRVIISDSAE